jgi:hypothetical protein
MMVVSQAISSIRSLRCLQENCHPSDRETLGWHRSECLATTASPREQQSVTGAIQMCASELYTKPQYIE